MRFFEKKKNSLFEYEYEYEYEKRNSLPL